MNKEKEKEKIDWSKFDRGVFLVNCLAVVHKNGKILIGRIEKDPYIPELTWCFPGGRPFYQHSLTNSLRMQVKLKTNLDINVLDVIFARNFPEKPEFLNIYYFCEVVEDSEEEKPGEKFKELKWVKPTEIQKYFTTSIDPVIMNFLEVLEKGAV